MGLFASSILVKYSLLNNSGSLVYAGTSSNSLRIWGAQLELAEYSEDILNDYINNYRYVRTTGQVQNFYGIRFGSGVNGDQSVDSILIGGSSGTRMNNVFAENTAFFVDKAAKRGTEIISLFTTSTSIAASSSYTFTSGTNLIINSESFATNWSINELTIDSTVNVPSPIGSFGDVKKLRENNINGRHWMSQIQVTGQNYSGVLSFYARAAERSILGVEISNFVTEAIYYIYNLSSGTISIRAPAVNDYSNVSASMISVGSGWYRCQLFWRRNAYSTATGNNPTFTVHDNLGAISYTGDNTSGLYLWGVQYGPQNQAIAELGYPLYIPTTSTLLTNYPVSSSANLLQNSNAFTASPWVTGNLSVNTSTAVTAPDGSSTVFLATEDNTFNQHLLQQSIGTVAVGQPFTFSAYLRANTSAALRQVSLTFHGLGYPIFDLTTGVVVSTGSGFSSASIRAVGNGWYRCTVQAAMPTTTGNFYILPWYWTNNYIGNNQSGFYVWGAQLTTSLAQQSQLVTTTSAAIGFFATSGIAVTTSFSIINTTSYNVLSTAYVSNFSGNLVTGASPDSVFVGQQYRPDTRLSGDPQERLNFDLRKRVKDTPGVDGTGVLVSDDRRSIPSNPVYDAAKVAGLELLKKTSQTFSYNRYTPVSGDNVYYNANDWFSEVGRSQRARMAIGGDTQVNFFDKRLDEVKPIPQNPRFDALRVMGIEPVYKTSSIITLSKYTPVHNSDYTYYKRYDWYSEVPRSQRARLALGIGDGSPLMFDNLQFVEDFTYGTIKGFAETLVLGYGTSSQTSRLAGRNDPETMKFTMLQAVKRGKDDLYIINNRHQTSSDAIQTQEIFYNKPGSIFGRRWYQLAPYFSNYSTIFDGQYGSDNVRVGDYYGGTRHSNNKQETMAIWFAPKTRAELLLTAEGQTRSVQKSALRSSYSSTTIQTVIRTNRIAQSERLDRTNFWSTTGATVTTSTALLSPLLPYRAVTYDADQLFEMFYNQPRQIDYRKWYTIVPLKTRTQSWTSNAINVINVTSSNSQHGVATLINFSIGLDNYYSYGMFVKQRTGVNRVRLYVGLPNLTTSTVDLMGGSTGYDLITDLTLPFSSDLMELGSDYEVPHYADFDLSSGTVLNRVNVSYANITARNNGWYLIKIAGPVSGTADAQTDIIGTGFRDTVNILDTYELTSNLFDNFIPVDLNA